MSNTDELETHFRQLETEELVLQIQRGGLTEEALRLAMREVSRRGLNEADLTAFVVPQEQFDENPIAPFWNMPTWLLKLILVVSAIAIATVLAVLLATSSQLVKSGIHIFAVAFVVAGWRAINRRAVSSNVDGQLHKKKVGLSPLMLASAEGDVGAIARLLSEGVIVDEPDRSGATALMFSVKNRQTDAVKILLEAGADPRRKTIKGLSAFDLASRSKQEQVFEILTAKLELSTVGKENRL
jgi:hypothetical protein